MAVDIEERQKVAEYTEKKIDEARVGYKPIAVQAALMFFSVISMSPLDPMY
jgi:dynein heavy chain, axonemal